MISPCKTVCVYTCCTHLWDICGTHQSVKNDEGWTFWVIFISSVQYSVQCEVFISISSFIKVIKQFLKAKRKVAKVDLELEKDGSLI